MRTKQEFTVQSRLLRKLISMILAVAMVLSSGAFAQLAPVVRAATESETSWEEDGHHYTKFIINADISLSVQNGASAGTVLYSPTKEDYTIGRGRVHYVQYDLTKVINALKADDSMNVSEALVYLTKEKSNGHTTELRYIPYNEWAETPDKVTYNSMDAAIEGGQFAPEILYSFPTTGLGTNKAFSANATRAITRENAEKNGTKFSFSFTGAYTSGTLTNGEEDGLDIYSAVASNESYRPYMEITIVDMEPDEIDKTQNRIRAQGVADSLSSTYTGMALDADLGLPTESLGVDIEWESSDPGAMEIVRDPDGTVYGKVTRQPEDGDDVRVTLTASCSYGEGANRQTVKQEIVVTVIKMNSNLYPLDIVGTQNSANANKTLRDTTAEVGRGRSIVAKFDISTVPATSSAIYVHIENVSGNNNQAIPSKVFMLPGTFDITDVTHNKIFASDAFEEFVVDGGEFIGGSVTIPKKQNTGELEVTRAVLKAKRLGWDTVVIGFAGDWAGDGTGKIATNTWTNANQKTYLHYESSTAEKNVEKAFAEASVIDGTVVYDDFEIPVDTAAGAVIEWTSDSTYAQIDGSTVRVQRPTGLKDELVTFTVTVTYGEVTDSRTYTVTIPTTYNEVSPYLEASLERMIEKAGQLMDLAVADHEYSEEELSADFNDYLLRKTVPVFEENGTFVDTTGAETAQTYQLVKQTEETVPRIDLTIEDDERQLGQLSKERYQDLVDAYDAASNVLSDRAEDQYSAEIQHLLRAGYEFIKSGKADDTLYTNKVSASDLWKLPAVASDDTGVADDATGFNTGARRYEKVKILPGDELAYSSYRAYEEGLVWKAYALMAIEPELYPQSAKDALMEKVGDAERALKGTYYIMYAKSRQFFQSRPDEQIQRTTLYQDKSPNFYDWEYGLAPCISWYRKQSRAAEVSYAIRGGVDENTLNYELVTNLTNQGTINNNQTNGSWITSGQEGELGWRLTFMQYNLKAFTDIAPIYSADIWSTNTQSSYFLAEYRLEANEPVDYYMANGVYENKGEWLYKMTQSYGGATVKICVLDGVLKRVYEGADAVTFSLRNIDPQGNSKTDVYSSRGATTVDNKGQLYIILEKINQNALAEEIDAEVEEETAWIEELRADGKVYTGDVSSAIPGAYPKEKVDAVQDAIDALKSGKNSKGSYELCALLKNLDDAVLALQDSIVLSTDVDEKNNLFFSAEEIEQMKKRVEEDPELNRAYNEIKNIADQQDPEEMMQLRYDKLDNETEVLDNKYKMWYGASNCNLTPKQSGLTNMKKAYVTVTLPAKLNEEAGLGHAWFDAISLSANSGAEMVVPNNIYRYGQSATQPANWNAYVYDAETNEELINLGKGTYNTTLPVRDEKGDPVQDANGRTVYKTTPLKKDGKISDYVKWQTGNAALASSGSNSIYLCNPSSETYAVWKSDIFEFPLDDYTMSFQVKQSGKFNIGGVEVQFHYLDENNQEIGQSSSFWTDVVGNITGFTSSNMAYQCATVAYLFTGDEKYAKIAKACMYTYLEEALLGAHSWENNYRHGRPAYGDVFGAVQNGRSGATLGTMYAVMKDVRLSNGAPLWSIEEKKQLVECIRLFCGDLMDVRDRSHLPYSVAAYNVGNWETDQTMGATMMGMAFAHDKGRAYTDEEVIAAGYVTEDGKADRDALEQDITLDHATRYIHNGQLIIKAAMAAGIRDDGAWPESLNYHSAMLEKLGTFSHANRFATGVDFWTITRTYDDPETQKQYGQLGSLAKMLKYYTMVQAPRFTNGNASGPGFGDGHYYSGSNYKYAGAYWHEMYETYEKLKAEGDLEAAEQYHILARDLYGCWNRSGRQRPQQANEENIMQVFFVYADWPEDDKAFLDTFSENQTSNDYMKYFGTYIMRNNFDVVDERTGKYKESYVAFMAQLQATGHNHYDEGSFLLYADSVPLVADPGMDNYWSAGKTSLLSSDCHSTVQLKKDASSYASVNTSVKDVDWFSSDKMDKVRTTLTYQQSVPGEVVRNYAFVKDGFEAHVIWDRVSGALLGSRMNLVLYTETSLPKKFTGNKIVADGFNDVNLEISVLQGNIDSYQGAEDRKASGSLTLRPGEINPIMDIMRIENDGNDNYLTVLFPTNDMGTRGTLDTSEVTVSSKAKIAGYKLSHDNGKHAVYVVVNDRNTAEQITLPEKVRLLNNEEETAYEANQPIDIQSGEMLLFSTNLSDEALETGTDEPKKAESQSPTQPNGSTGSSGGVAGGAGGAAVSGGATNNGQADEVKGNNNKVDLNAPGTSGAPKASVPGNVEEGTFELNVEDGYTAYYSVNGADYLKYTGPVSVADGDEIIYFTVNDRTGGKTMGIRMTATGGKQPKVPKKYGVAKGKHNQIRIYNAKGATGIKYKSANTKIATVSKTGRVTGKKLGNTKVTVTFNLNGKKYKLKTTIKVKKKYKAAR